MSLSPQAQYKIHLGDKITRLKSSIQNNTDKIHNFEYSRDDISLDF